MLKIGFTGTQNGMNDFQKNELLNYFKSFDPEEFHHGDCIGSDNEAHFMFLRYHVENDIKERKIIIHPPTNDGKQAFTWYTANWSDSLKASLRDCKHKITLETREPFAYLIRNQDIVRETEVLIACPKEMEHTLRSGTWATIRYAWKMQKQVIVIPPVILGV